ncbi:MAG TPA: class I SAM-dependent methyltransferase [Pseudonocardiaceae bacterium]|nr:class I SAM-dependent methyltransferase [Pseudonocardiaceae bacterium]
MPDRSRADFIEDFDFEALYQGDPPREGLASFDVIPWDIGEPQPAVVALERSGQLHGHILDAGCGLGDNALFVAECGYRVTGFDAAPTAITRARERAEDRRVAAELIQADATRLDGFEQRFTTVLDSALYHCLGDHQRAAYASALHRVTRPGAHLHLFCFADTDSPGLKLPIRTSQDNLRAHLSGRWSIRSIELTHYTTAITRAFLERQDSDTLQAMGIDVDIDARRTDELGRITSPVWHLHAIRLPDDKVSRATATHTQHTETGGTK